MLLSSDRPAIILQSAHDLRLCCYKTTLLSRQRILTTVSIGQGRLLALLVKIDSPAIRQSHCSDIEKAADCKSLLDFALNKMVDYKQDVVAHLGLIQFFTDWLKVCSVISCSGKSGVYPLERERARWSYSVVENQLTLKQESLSHGPRFNNSMPDSPALYYLQASGLHARTADYYHSPNSSTRCSSQNGSFQDYDSRVLYTQACHYLETYYVLHAKVRVLTSNARLPKCGMTDFKV